MTLEEHIRTREDWVKQRMPWQYRGLMTKLNVDFLKYEQNLIMNKIHLVKNRLFTEHVFCTSDKLHN